MIQKILVTGANGQLGSVLTKSLQQRYGINTVIASDIGNPTNYDGIFEIVDVTDLKRLTQVVQEHSITEIYHLAAVLSANGEKNPLKTWDINMLTLLNVLTVSKENGIGKVFFPSSIAVFGQGVPKRDTPNNAILNPETVYGISKAAGENWCNYYYLKYGLDVRSLRYPGIIGYDSLPGGGTTDYAVDIYHKAVKRESFNCFVSKNTVLPMIFMEDAIRATIELMEAPKESIKIRTSYNIAGASFSPADMAREICKKIPEFKINYEPDFRQEIADKWPESISDVEARNDWCWHPKYNLKDMTKTMLYKLEEQYAVGGIS